MDDEHSVIIVQYEHDLQEPTTSAPAPHKPFVVFTPQWIGSCGLLHDLLRFLNTHAMGLDVINVGHGQCSRFGRTPSLYVDGEQRDYWKVLSANSLLAAATVAA